MNRRRARERRGRLAEAKAVWRLRLAGWRILARRFRGRGGEIDIVALRGGVLAFVEVKARADSGLAAESIAPRQRLRIRRAAEQFVMHNPAYGAHTLRFDAMLVAPWQLPRHVIDAWRD